MENANSNNIVVVKVNITFNNVWIYVPDDNGELTIDTSLRKSTNKRTSNEAIKTLAETVIDELKQKNISKVIIKYKGMGEGINIILDSFRKSSVEVVHVLNMTPIPHNACIPVPQCIPKRRTKKEDNNNA